MDAFLKPSADTDSTGVPVELKTERFYGMLQTKLRPGGLVVFNLNRHVERDEDIERIASSFARVVILDVAGAGNVVVLGCTNEGELEGEELAARLRELDARFAADFSFESLWAARRP